jgi:hypothetical protein
MCRYAKDQMMAMLEKTIPILIESMKYDTRKDTINFALPSH